MTKLAVKASGMVTSAGLNAPSCLAAMRAGIRCVKQTNLWDPESGTYLSAGKAPLPQWWVGIGKLADLVAPAIVECLKAAQPAKTSEIPVLLGIAPTSRPFRFPELESLIFPEVEQRIGSRLHTASRVYSLDHVSVVASLIDAEQLIRRGEARMVIIAAVDSLLVHDLKNYYLAKRRLLTPLNSNGFCLGEAGSAVLMAPTASDGSPELQICGMAITQEDSTIESDRPLRAEGLTQAIRETLKQSDLAMDDVHYRITDLNGEHYKFKEMTLAMGRFCRKASPEIFDLWHPNEYLGDVGAAIGPIVLGVALDASQKAYATGSTALCTFTNDGHERAALIVKYSSGSSL